MKKPIISVALATIAFVCISSAASADYLRVGEVKAEWEPLLAMGFMTRRSTVDGTEMRNGRIVPFRTQFDLVSEIKLNCQISLTRSYSTGTIQKEQISEVVEISQSGSRLSIGTVHLGAVSTDFTGTSNFSDVNRWPLELRDSRVWTKIIIDRNTGQIFYTRDQMNGAMVVEGYGNCRKIDTDKKLF